MYCLGTGGDIYLDRGGKVYLVITGWWVQCAHSKVVRTLKVEVHFGPIQMIGI